MEPAPAMTMRGSLLIMGVSSGRSIQVRIYVTGYVTGWRFSSIALHMKSSTDPIQNLAELIACPSVTPQEGGALTAVQSMLEPLGFSVDRPVFSDDGTPD